MREKHEKIEPHIKIYEKIQILMILKLKYANFTNLKALFW